MTISKRTVLSFPPVKALRRARWQVRAYAGMLPKSAAAAAERLPALKRMTERLIGTDGDDPQWYRAAYGFSLNEFRCYGFADKDREARLRYLSDRESVLLSYLVNDLDAMGIFSDKWKTYRQFHAFYGRDLCCVASPKDRAAFDAFLRRHPVFAAKPASGSCGKGVKQIDASALDDGWDLLDRLTADGKTVIEETIAQSGDMASFHPASVNTVRVVTFVSGGRPTLLWAFLKTGRGGSFTDNGASGGIMAGIDLADGSVVTSGIDEAGTRYSRHPDTGVPFAGFVVPEWDALRRRCLSLASVLPQVRLVGWDMAHTPKGWIVVEGNAQPEMIGPQAVFGKGLRRDVMSLLHKERISVKSFRINK